MSFLAGKYTVTYDGATVGQTRDGIRIEWFANKQLITGDNEGLTPQDAVFQGYEVFIEFVCLEYNYVKTLLAAWPYSSTVWALGNQGNVGRTDVGSSLAKVLILTNTPGTPAAGTPTTITCTYAVLAEGFPVQILMAPALREVPLRFRLYPNASHQFFVVVNS